MSLTWRQCGQERGSLEGRLASWKAVTTPFFPVRTRTARAAVGVFAWIGFVSLLLVLVCFLCWPCVQSCQGRLLGGVCFSDVPFYFSLGLGFGIYVLQEAGRAGLWVPVDAGVGSATEHVHVNIRIYPPRGGGRLCRPQAKGWLARAQAVPSWTPWPHLWIAQLGCVDGLSSLCPLHWLWCGRVRRPARHAGSIEGYEAPESAPAFRFLSECKTS